MPPKRSRSPEKLQQRSSPDLLQAIELASEALGSPRALTPQVLQYLLAHHEVKGNEVLAWLKEKLSGLESYEHDLLLSPLFTPDFPARLKFEGMLGESWFSTAEVDRLIENLNERGLRLTLHDEGDRVETSLSPVLVARFVHLLHLDTELPLDLLEPFRPLEAEVRCHLRDRAWQRLQTRKLLPLLFEAAQSAGEDFSGYVSFLTDFVRSHRPASREECISFLQNTAKAYEDDLKSHRSGVRPFFDQELKNSYSGKWKVADEVVAEHQRMISMARTLLAALVGEP